MTRQPVRRTRFVPRTRPVEDGYDTGACRCPTITDHRQRPILHRRQQCIDAREAQQQSG